VSHLVGRTRKITSVDADQLTTDDDKASTAGGAALLRHSVLGIRVPTLRAFVLHTSTIPLLALAVVVAIRRSDGIDDAYISYRYAENLSSGRGLVFNAGDRVEGVSNLLWTLLLAGVHALGVPIPTAATILGVIGLAATVVLTRRVARRLRLPPLAATAAAGGVAVTTDLVSSATMGLEGGLFSALLLATVLTWGRLGWHELFFAIAVASLAATRPEGILLGAILALSSILATSKLAQTTPYQRLRAPAAALFGIALLEVWRFHYYGELVPMSVTAKRDIGSSPVASLLRHGPAGARYVVVRVGLPLFVAVVIILATSASSGWRQWSNSAMRPKALGGVSNATLLPAILLVATGLVLPIMSGGDWMPFSRLISPYFPLMYVLLAAAALSVGSRGALAASVVLPVAMAAAGHHGPALRDGRGNPLDTDSSFSVVGSALQESALDGRVVATEVLGHVSFAAPDVRFTDVLGLTDPVVARTPGDGSPFGKKNYRYTQSLKPAAFMTNSWKAVPEFLSRGGSNAVSYVAVTSAQLNRNRVFLLIDPAVAGRFSRVLASHDLGLEIVPPGVALARWRQLYPDGQ